MATPRNFQADFQIKKKSDIQEFLFFEIDGNIVFSNT